MILTRSALAAALLLSPAVFAAGTTATVAFFPVTQYTDDTPFPASDVLKYTIKWSGGSLDVASPTACPTGGKLCVDVPVPCGDRAFIVTVTPKPTAKYPVTSPDSAPPATYASGVTCGPKAVTGVTAS